MRDGGAQRPRSQSSGAKGGEGGNAWRAAYQAPSLSLPKGGGAIRGIGEKFSAHAITGTGTMSVPLPTAHARSGVAPQLSLSYDSASGNTPFGFGWTLSLPSIARKTDKGLPQYDDDTESDVFILAGAEDLVPVYRQEADGSWTHDMQGRMVAHEDTVEGHRVRRYRPRVEGMFARIERWSRIGAPADVHWRSISKENILTVYGLDANSRIADPLDARRIYNWLACETRDDKGNGVLFRYRAEDGTGVRLDAASERNRGARDDPRRGANRYLKRVHYGNRVPLLDASGERPHFLDAAQVAAQLAAAQWMFELVFDYGDHDAAVPRPGDDQLLEGGAPKYPWALRTDPFSSFRARFEVRTQRLCKRALLFHHFPDVAEVGRDCLVRSAEFAFPAEVVPTEVATPVYACLQSVTHRGWRRNAGGYDGASLPPVEFEYSQAEVQDTLEEIDAASLANLPAGLDGHGYRWTDLHGEGLPGILSEQSGAWYYKRNLSPLSVPATDTSPAPTARFAATEAVALRPAASLAAGAEIMDLAGDGQPDVVMLNGPTPGFYEHGDTAEDWQAFRAFSSQLHQDARDPNLRFIDLDGDGRADVLVSENDAFVWHAGLAEDGFGPARRVARALDEEQGPRIVFADGTQTLFLADMSGDGLTDIVRVRNGEVCYWPNTGYGQFGAKVSMDNAPWFDAPDQFDPRRLRLADIDGSGTADIVYLHGGGVRLYLNQCGNAWSQPRALKVFPRPDEVAGVAAVDLLGNGTACLVWSSPLAGDARRQMRYVNLMGARKPHLLVATRNNLGSETRIHYASSTRFYLQDKMAGRPWIARLPFPVHVVERIEIHDHVSRNRFVTRYAYHHGHFDGEEREFRGFGMVEQWDTEELGALSADGAPPADNMDAASHLPPVHTKTWFHTGIYLGRERVSRLFEQEYWREPGLGEDAARAMLLPDSVLPTGLEVDDEREACRALRGSLLRSEIYADDAVAGATPAQLLRAATPYSVTEQNFRLRVLQPRGGNRHIVVFTHAGEGVDFHYERNAADPRVQHAITLEVDLHGNVQKQVSIAYGRRPGMSPLAAADRARQERALATYTENLFTNAVATERAHGLPLPCAATTWELTGYSATGPAGRFAAADLVEPDPGHPGQLRHRFTDEVAYEAEPTANACRRRVEALRTLYRRDDLAGLLPLGSVQPLRLPGESYHLAFTPGLLATTYLRPHSGMPPEELLPTPASVLGSQAGDGGGYVSSDTLKAAGLFPAADGDGHWWTPSGRVYFSDDPAHSAAAELAQARAHFFLPRRSRDAFGQDAVTDYDSRDLLMAASRDALGNRMTVEANDYRVLQPRLVRDPNRNRTAVAFDILGMVVGTALMGKAAPAPAEGDSLDGFATDLTQAQTDAFFDAADPVAGAAALLKDAGSRFVYDLHRFHATRLAHPDDPSLWLPACAATLTRETHAAAPLPPHGLRIQVGFSYSDGFGREIQKKAQAEAGPLAEGGPVLARRWVANGWVVFNNKGLPVRQYEPFFSASHQFEFGVQAGVSAVLFYDPSERAVATLHPDHSYDKVVFGAWGQTSWDASDTCAARNAQTGDPRTDPDIAGYVASYFAALGPAGAAWQTWHARRIGGALGDDERHAAERAAGHADTPSTAHLDALGRPFMTEARNRVVCTGHDLDGTEETLRTRVELDIEGNQRVLRDAAVQAGDALGRVVMRYAYDLAGNRIHHASMEAGARWMLDDAQGKPIRAWDSRGHAFASAYDALRRPLHQLVRGSTADCDPRTLGTELMFDRMEYGEPPAGASAADEDRACALNLRTRLYRQFDTAGVSTHAALDAGGDPVLAYDFKGNLRASTRRLLADYKALPDWRATPALEDESFAGATRFDAVNRPLQIVAPHSSLARAKRNVIQPVFNEANLLEQVDVWLQRAADPTAPLDPAVDAPSPVGVANIDYDARGRRTRIDYRNGAGTRYAYDPETFRLAHLSTRRGAAPADNLQDLRYTYDPGGNLTHIQDGAQQDVYFRNRLVEAHNDYIYDALNRLIQATGREHLGQAAGVRKPPTAPDAGNAFHTRLDHPGNGDAMGTYLERYVYDAAGNFAAVQHRGSDPAHPGWTRAYAHTEASQLEDGSGGTLAKTGNRLGSTTLDPDGGVAQPEGYLHDVHGNLARLPHLGGGAPGANLHWDLRDHMHQADLGGGGTAYYAYSGAGQRVRKVWEKAPGLTEERIYLDGFEIFRRHPGAIGAGTATLERETLHVMDDTRRIALVEMRTLDTAGTDPAPARMVRYQLGNHLGSASLELDDTAQIISYEEYSPYGSSTYQAVRSQTETPKRYRFGAKERDEETGLYDHGGRQYMPWLGRWTQCDPAEFVDGLNLYAFVSGNPVRFSDPSGFDKQDQRLGASMEKASKTHQDAANARRGQKGLKPVDVKRQQGVGGKRDVIPDEVKTTPGGTQKVVDTKARHVDSARNLSAAERARDIEKNLEQVKTQLRELEKAGEITSKTKGAALRVIHDSDKGVSSAAAVEAWRKEATAVREAWVKAAPNEAERLLRSRVLVTTTTRASYTRATESLVPKKPRGGGKAGLVIGLAIAAYILFDTGDAFAAGQAVNPAANTTDVFASGNITLLGVAEAVIKDGISLTPPGAAAMLIWTLMQPRGEFRYSEKLAQKAIKEGRNPFCAQCHGPGGALDPNNEWNQRYERERLQEFMQRWQKVDDAAIRQFLAPQK